MARRLTHKNGKFADGTLFVEVKNDGTVWNGQRKSKPVPIMRGAIAGADGLPECLNMVAYSDWGEIAAPKEAPDSEKDMPAAATADHW